MPYDFLPSFPPSPNSLTVFGLLLAAGAIGGFIAHRRNWLPSITGFMLVGFVMGPSGLHLLSHEALNEARVLVDIALGLILYRLGISLNIHDVRNSRFLQIAPLVESAATLLLVWVALSLFGVDSLTALLIGAITISSSPAVLIHVSHELRAAGPVAETAKPLVAINNIIAFIAFTAILPAFHATNQAPWQTMVFQPPYRLLGSLIIAGLIGYALHRLARSSRDAPQYRLALVIGAVMLSLGLAKMLNLSMLLAPLALGVVVRNLEKQAQIADVEFGEAFELFFIVLFVFAGANLHVQALIAFGPAALALVAARSLAKWGAIYGVATWQRRPVEQAKSIGILLIPMAGLAIGLVSTTETLFPQSAATVSAVVLAAVAIFETIGPPLAGYAFQVAGEVGKADSHHG